MDKPAPYGASAPARITFHAGQSGQWSVIDQSACIGEGLPRAPSIAIGIDAGDNGRNSLWSLSGFTSNLRYTSQKDRSSLDMLSAPLGRGEARFAALIPICKSPQWWALAQDQRQDIYARSAHTAIGMRYLPQIARKLFHSRDLGQPFDFLTWFEFAPEASHAFDDLLANLRSTEEWSYVIREVDIRLTRIG